MKWKSTGRKQKLKSNQIGNLLNNSFSIPAIRPVLFFLSLFFTLSLLAQPVLFSEYSYKPDKDYFKSYLTVTKKIVTGPARWKAKEWIITGSVIAGGATLLIFDDEIRKFFQRNTNPTLDNISKYVVEPWGSGLYPAIMFGSYYLYGLAADNTRARQIALGGTQAFVMAAVTSQVLKHVFHRHRPSQNDPPDPYLWEGPFQGWNYTSFPSGHTTAAFAIASFMQQVYKDKLWVGILSYTVATGVGLSRVYDNVHWPSDVLVGAALGFGIGQAVYNVMSNDSRLSMGVSSYGGISLTYSLR